MELHLLRVLYIIVEYFPTMLQCFGGRLVYVLAGCELAHASRVCGNDAAMRSPED